MVTVYYAALARLRGTLCPFRSSTRILRSFYEEGFDHYQPSGKHVGYSHFQNHAQGAQICNCSQCSWIHSSATIVQAISSAEFRGI